MSMKVHFEDINDVRIFDMQGTEYFLCKTKNNDELAKEVMQKISFFQEFIEKEMESLKKERELLHDEMREG